MYYSKFKSILLFCNVRNNYLNTGKKTDSMPRVIEARSINEYGHTSATDGIHSFLMLSLSDGGKYLKASK